MIYFLHTVGTALDPVTLMTHPINTDGTVDKDEGMAVHISDCCDEWWETLANSGHMRDVQLVGRVFR